MSAKFAETWVPRLLFSVALALAALLAGAVVLTPHVDAAAIPAGWMGRLLSLFAHDSSVRRTALVSAGGLVITAFVFFRSRSPEPENKNRSAKITPPGNFAGA